MVAMIDTARISTDQVCGIALSGLTEERGIRVRVLTAMLAGDDHVRRREQKDLGCDALDLAVQTLRQSAGEIDEAPGISFAHLRKIDDDRDPFAEGLGNQLSIAVLPGVDRQNLIHLLYRRVPCRT